MDCRPGNNTRRKCPRRCRGESSASSAHVKISYGHCSSTRVCNTRPAVTQIPRRPVTRFPDCQPKKNVRAGVFVTRIAESQKFYLYLNSHVCGISVSVVPFPPGHYLQGTLPRRRAPGWPDRSARLGRRDHCRSLFSMVRTCLHFHDPPGGTTTGVSIAAASTHTNAL